MKRPTYTSVFISGLIAPSIAVTANAQPVDTSADIMVTSPILERSLYDTPAAMSVIKREPIHEAQPKLKLDETLSQVPGIFLQNQENFAQGERIAIRGLERGRLLGFVALRLWLMASPTPSQTVRRS